MARKRGPEQPYGEWPTQNDRKRRCKEVSNGSEYNANHQRRSKRVKSERSSLPSSSSSLDDDVGHFSWQEGQVIKERYILEREMGKGTFGKVLQSYDPKHRARVAIKVIRSIKRYIDSAKIEADILNDIYEKQKNNKDQLCVKMYAQFRLNGHYCLVFEPLGVSLYDLVKANNYKRLPLFCVRNVAEQLLQALDFLRSIGLIHTDLKLENVLFVDKQVTTYAVEHGSHWYDVSVPVDQRIKIIDFGGATYNVDAKRSSIINTRQYRGPEVTLELGWSYPSDIWSAGCILAEIYSGELLFLTHDELEHLALMERRIGLMPYDMIDRAGQLGDQYFHHRNGTVRLEQLSRSSRKFVKDTVPLDKYFSLAPEDKHSGICELIQAMLRLNPAQRVSAREAQQFKFVSNAAASDNKRQHINPPHRSAVVSSRSGSSKSANFDRIDNDNSRARGRCCRDNKRATS